MAQIALSTLNFYSIL